MDTAKLPCTLIAALPQNRIALFEYGGRICQLRFLPETVPLQAPTTRLAEELARQLETYLRDPYAPFSVAVADIQPSGSAFQDRVWAAIRAIAPGHIRRYGELAAQLGSAARAVGQACGANPLPLLVPCHRVVNARGLGGFAHSQERWLLDTKRSLLVHEGACLL